MFIFEDEKNGTYLTYSESNGHTGKKIHKGFTTDINKATTFRWTYGYNFNKMIQELNLVRKEVEVVTTVTLK